MKEIFDNYIEGAFGTSEQSAVKLEQFKKNYMEFFPKDSSAKLLDIGIGRGEMLSCMENWGYKDYLGIDISPSTVEFCQSLGLRCSLVEDTSKWLSQHKSSFDLVTLLDVLEHIEKNDIIPFIRGIYEAVKPGGKIIIQVPNMQAPGAHLHRYNDITHQVGFIENSLREVLSISGIKDFTFLGFDEIVTEGIKTRIWLILRSLYWRNIRFWRKINSNLNPSILNPVFFAVITK